MIKWIKETILEAEITLDKIDQQTKYGIIAKTTVDNYIDMLNIIPKLEYAYISIKKILKNNENKILLNKLVLYKIMVTRQLRQVYHIQFVLNQFVIDTNNNL